MQGVLQGFSVVLILIGIGLLTSIALPRKRAAIAQGLTPLIFYITNPALMFTLLASTDLRAVVGVFTPIALLVAVVTGAAYALVARLVFKTPAHRLPAAAMSTSYVNAGNIGVPLALYAVGSTSPVVSVLIAQLLIIAPVYLCMFAVLSRAKSGATDRSHGAKMILKSIANPVTIATFLGAVFSFFDLELPEVIHAPVQMIGDASIPLLLMSFGMALYGQRPFSDKDLRGEIYLATAFKVFFMPLIAWLAARFVFGLSGIELLGVVIMAALPTAQNVLLFAQQFKLPVAVPREVVLASTLLTFPSVLVIAFLLS